LSQAPSPCGQQWQANALLCSREGGGNTTGSLGAGTLAAVAGCNNDWGWWWVGSRTQWNIDSTTYMGLDVIYNKLLSADTFNGLITPSQATIGAASAVPTQTFGIKDEGVVSVRFRVHRNFYP
jgi:hypothetical protein